MANETYAKRSKAVVLILCSLVLLYPLWLMFVGSLQDIRGVMRMPPNLIPVNPTLENYRALVKESHFVRWVMVTALLSGTGVSLLVLVTCMAGYGLSQWPSAITKVASSLFILSIMIPRQCLLIPLYVLVKRLHFHPWIAVVLPLSYFPVGIILAKNYFDTIGRSVIESARIDGANEVTILTRIVMPLSRPILGVMAIFGFIFVLSDYVWQYLLLTRPSQQTLLVGLLSIVVKKSGMIQVNPIGMQLAAGTILFVPMLIVFVIFQKQFISGLTMGGEK